MLRSNGQRLAVSRTTLSPHSCHHIICRSVVAPELEEVRESSLLKLFSYGEKCMLGKQDLPEFASAVLKALNLNTNVS